MHLKGKVQVLVTNCNKLEKWSTISPDVSSKIVTIYKHMNKHIEAVKTKIISLQ